MILPDLSYVTHGVPPALLRRQREVIAELESFKTVVAREGNTPLVEALGNAALIECERVQACFQELRR